MSFLSDETLQLITLLQPEALRPFLEQGDLFLARGDTVSAATRYREVLARDPDHLRAEWELLRLGEMADIDLNSEVLAVYEGEYGNAPFNATIVSDGAQLLVELPGAPAAFPLLPVTNTRFFVDKISRPLRITFMPGDDGTVEAIEVKDVGFFRTFVRR